MSATAPSQSLPFRLNFDEAFRFVGRAHDWPARLGLGALFSVLSVVLVGYILVQGYLLTLIERVARAEPVALPEWRDYGELLRKGAIVFVVNLVYYLPLLVLGVLVVGGQFILIFALEGASSSSGAAAPAGAAVAAYMLFLLVGYGLLFLLGILTNAVVPAAHAQLVLHDTELAAAFRLGEVFGFIRRYAGQYVVAVALYLAASYLLVNLGYFLCCVGIFVASFVCQLFLSHLIGQLCWHERMTRPVARRME